MKILLTGSSGLIGSHLSESLLRQGHSVIRLVRSPSAAASTIVLWDPGAPDLANRNELEGLDVVIHLAGENVSGRWTQEKKNRIRDSRVQGTRLLSRTLSQLERKPSIFICASAIGFYGNSGDAVVDEFSPSGQGFLASVCREWEQATRTASDAGIRVVQTRFGMVLDSQGGALAKMLPVFRRGLGGVVGDGTQVYSWITVSDAIRAVEHVIHEPLISGPVNVVSPNPVTNRQFTDALGTALNKATPFPMPTFLVRIAFGEMGEELLLASCRVRPTRLLETGFEFGQADLADAFARLIDKST